MIYNIIKNIGDVMEAKELKEEIKTLQKGDILFVIGENSIGKTTLFSKVDKNIICKELNKNTAVKNLIKNDEIIKEFNIEYLLERKINTLSTGEKTLITILSNLENEILIVDDILKNLDSKTKEKLLKKIKKLRKDRITIFLTTTSDDILFGNKTLIMSKEKYLLLDTKKILEEKNFKKANITLPFVIDLSKKLSYYGLVNKNYYEIDKLVNDLWK